MKRKMTAIAFMLLCVCSVAFAQDRDQSVYLEAMGPSNMLGVSYDARIKPGSKLGYRVGLGYSALDLLDVPEDQRFISVPLGLNYLAGNGSHRLEVGAGACPGLYRRSYDVRKYNEAGEQIAKDKKSENLFGCIAYANVGYRYTAKNGLQLRCGISPILAFGNKHADKKIRAFYPYVSVGYAF